MQDHGGNIDWAIAHFGDHHAGWIDLSTGINRVPYPIPPLSDDAWTQLPTRAATDGLIRAARAAYHTSAAVLPVAGAQAAIQMIPRSVTAGRARVLAPTYNEHAASLRAAGWLVDQVAEPADLVGADLAVVVNPNNPDGNSYAAKGLLALSDQVGTLIVDESFADARPELSIAPKVGSAPGLFVLKSFGKFFGLAGLRLGFVLGHADAISALSDMAGPWPVSGAALQIGKKALGDVQWHEATVARLRAEVILMDRLAASAGWQNVGGCELFRLYDTDDALAAQEHLARAGIWSRVFPYSRRWIRLGLPGSKAEWSRLAAVLR